MSSRSIQIIPFSERPDLASRVKSFNARLAAGGFSEFHFSESPESRRFPKMEGRPIWMEYFVASDASEVRGGYILKHQPFSIKGKYYNLTFLKLPVSEGIVNPEYAHLGIQLLQDSETRAPQLFALGMGGLNAKLPGILRRMKWQTEEVPFYFQICNFPRFLRHADYARRTPRLRALSWMMRWSGSAHAAGAAINLYGKFKLRQVDMTEAVQVAHFESWADELWASCSPCYGLAGERTSATLNLLYPADDPRLIRLQIIRQAKPIGWVVAAHTRHSDHKYFGDLTVTAIVDCWSRPADAELVAAAATRLLRQFSPDLLVSNQMHRTWQEALTRSGFLRGPSNFAIALSKSTTAKLLSCNVKPEDIHINRGDGDGPIHL